jgi:ubiquinone/menaquinone biosynthesis C-methylase UbiE
VRRLTPEQAYGLWAATYESQDDNLILALEADVFRTLLAEVSLADKRVGDVGCGTGRHWEEMLSRKPLALEGVDSSPEMLERLRRRHPAAVLHRRSGPELDAWGDASLDVIVSTLMLGHARDAARELREWRRVLRPGGEILVTEFHPSAARAGMKRTFDHGGRTFEVEHRLGSLPALHDLLRSLGFGVLRFEERALDERTRPFFERRGYMEGYTKGFGTPLVLGFRLRAG